MNGEGGSESFQKRRQRWQISLTDMILLVVATGVAAGIARGSREVWGAGLIRSGTAAPIERTAGLVLEIAAVFLVVILCREAMGSVRGQPNAEPARSGVRAWAIGWRLATVTFLLWFVACESSVLRITESTVASSSRGGWWNYRVRQDLFPVCALLAMLGMAVGMGAGTIFGEPSSFRRRPYWLFVLLAGLVCFLIVAQHDWPVIMHLVLIAIEHVTNAMRHRLEGRPGLGARLLRAGMDAAVAVAVCLALALAIGRDFERARRNEPWATSRIGRCVRFLLLATTAGAGIYLARVTIPAIHPCLEEGFFQVLGRGDVIMILGGFGFFAMGLAARTLVPPASRDRPRWLTWFSPCLHYGVLGLLALSTLKSFPSAAQLEPTIPSRLTVAIDIVQQLNARIWSLLPDPFVAGLFQWLAMDQLLWTLMTLGLVAFVVELAIRPKGTAFSPFDALAGSRCLVVRASWLVAALVVLCLAALPTLIATGQVIMYFRLWH